MASRRPTTSRRCHGITDVCVVEKGWLAGGNMARNTTIIRSNYLWDESAAIYEHSLKLWEGLEDALGADLQFSHRGVLNLAHDLGEVRSSMRRVHANRLNGVDAEWLTPEEVSAFCPLINVSPSLRYPVLGATLQRRGGDGPARQGGVGLRDPGQVRSASTSWSTPRSPVSSGGPADAWRACRRRAARSGATVALAAAGHTSELASMVGLRLPVQSHPLQALVSALYEPVLDCVVMSNKVHVDVSQADKGELLMGAGIDAYNGYAPAGVVPRDRATARGGRRALPDLRARQAAAVLGRDRRRAPRCLADRGVIAVIDGLFLNCGWGTGGFKATPGRRMGLCGDDRDGRTIRARAAPSRWSASRRER